MTLKTAAISTARKGDIVRFKSYALRVEREPEHKGGRVHLFGRTNIDGCPLVSRSFLPDFAVRIERKA